VVQGKSRGLVAKYKLAGQDHLRDRARALPHLLPGGAGEHHAVHRDQRPLLQVRGGELRAAALRDLRDLHRRGHQQRREPRGRSRRARDGTHRDRGGLPSRSSPYIFGRTDATFVPQPLLPARSG
jgi:hypothetical protein